MWALPPVPERASISRDVGQPIGPGRLAWGSILAGLGCLPIARESLPRLGVALVAVLIVTAGLVIYVRRRIGGMTGDCLGFLCYAAQITVLLVSTARWPGSSGA